MHKPSWFKLTKPDSTMNWFEKLESRKNQVVWTTLLLMIAIIAATSLRLSWAYDIYWHLQMGKDWVENGLSLYRDHYSFTFEGAEIRSPAALFEIGIHFVVKWLGLETGFKVYKFVALSLTLCLAAAWLRMLRAPVIAYMFVLPMMTVLLQLRAIERPELVGFSLIVVGIMLYQRSIEVGRISANTMLPIIALMVFWTNYHGAILGYVLFFGLFVDLALKQLSQRVDFSIWLRWGAWGLIVLLAGLAKPNFSHPVMEMLTFSNEWKVHIEEYRSPSDLLRVPAIYALATICLVTLSMLVRQRRFGLLIVSAIFLYNAVTTIRMVAPAGVLLLCIFGLVLRDMPVEAWVKRTPKWRSGVAAAAVWMTLIASLVSSVATARSFIEGNVDLHSRYPHSMAAYMRETGAIGRIFNEYQIGGYLIHALNGEAKVYIDGRTAILYSLEHFYRYRAALESAERMQAEVEKYDIEYAVFTNHPDLAKLMTETGVMGLDFVDQRYSLYRRHNPGLPIMGFLWGEPACWKQELEESILAEQRHALWELPPFSPMLPYVHLVAEYTTIEETGKRAEFLGEAELDEVVGRRFVGYRALELGAFDLGADVFSGLQQKRPRDLLAVAWSLTELGHFEQAERYLDTVTRMKLETVHENDLVVLHRLLRDIDAAGHLKSFEAEYVDGLTEQVRHLGPERLDEPVSAESFCVSAAPGVSRN